MSVMYAGMLWGQRVLRRHPITRGMLTYSVLWPTSNLVQQAIDPTRKGYDLTECFRFFIQGTFITAPTVFIWVKIASKLVKGNGFRHALLKAFYDITLFAPVGQSQFYFCISALEGRPLPECVEEVRSKLFASWKVATCFWPFVQTVNFAYVAERNRVVVVAAGSFVWTVFLSYMHHSDGQALPAFFRPKKVLKDDEVTDQAVVESTKTEKEVKMAVSSK